ncbi:MAG: hypothetical protein C0624_08995 [Desulfuromonas sp.]|nr:MAG: hypothetical protein C0624_08995 [Desulfuromonas sp.]
MNCRFRDVARQLCRLAVLFAFVTLGATPVLATGYDNALHGVKSFKAIYQISQGNPKVANAVFWAVRNSYQATEVKKIKGDPEIAIVFHGPAVKLISSDKKFFDEAQWPEVQKFQQTLREMKKEGVKLEVCQYAAKVLGVDRETIIPEVDQVGNGFVSVIGYQMQGYAVVRIP